MDYKKLLDPEKLKRDFESSRMKNLAYELFVNADEVFLLPANQFKIYLYIFTQCCHEDDFFNGVIITIENFSKELGISQYTVIGSIKNLIRLGYIKSEVSHKFGTRYYIN